jgi:Kyakuja-Dileera-Zisupton transposase
MDYIIFSVFIGTILPWIVLTYDIGCHWSKNMRKRNKEYLEAMQISPDAHVDVAIPSWHINSHGESCRNNFCLSYLVGAGRTCGEDVETSWSHTNPLAPSIREMGPAARHDTLNDHWSGWNFHKIVGFRAYFLFLVATSQTDTFYSLGTLFLKRFKTAFVMEQRHKSVSEQLSNTFSNDINKKWDAMVKTWNRDKTAPNPYAEPQCSTFLLFLEYEMAF